MAARLKKIKSDWISDDVWYAMTVNSVTLYIENYILNILILNEFVNMF